MHTLVYLLLLSVLASQAQTRHPTEEWPRFRDDAHHVSFAYPPDLRPVTVSAESLHIDGLVKKVSVVSNDPRTTGLPVLTVNAFICDDPKLHPGVPCRDESSYRTWCDRFETFPVGDSRAIQCVTYSRGACSWSAIVLRDKGSVEISAPAAEYAANLSTRDRSECAARVAAARTASPVREMLASFRLRNE